MNQLFLGISYPYPISIKAYSKQLPHTLQLMTYHNQEYQSARHLLEALRQTSKPHHQSNGYATPAISSMSANRQHHLNSVGCQYTQEYQSSLLSVSFQKEFLSSLKHLSAYWKLMPLQNYYQFPVSLIRQKRPQISQAGHCLHL